MSKRRERNDKKNRRDRVLIIYLKLVINCDVRKGTLRGAFLMQ